MNITREGEDSASAARSNPAAGADVSALFGGIVGGSAICMWDHPVQDIDALAAAILSPAERLLWNDRAPRAKKPWLLGRAAAKEALARILGPIALPDVSVLNDDRGRPYAVTTSRETPRISIAHKDFAGVAIAAGPDHVSGVGIDMEPIGTVSPEVLREACSPRERTVIDAAAGEAGLWPTAAWCAKEAVGKALGTGLQRGPRSVSVESIDSPAGLMAMRYEEQDLEVVVRRLGDVVIAVCLIKDAE